MAVSTPQSFGAGSAAAITEQLTSSRRDVRGRIIEWVLLGALIASLLILVALVANLLQR